jgi:two-component system NtrC family response regulator
VDVRLVAATNTNLWQEVESGRFREDLYYRLNVISIELPPLRDRREDIPPLAAHFLKVYADENERDVGGFSPSAMDAMTEYSWPGNVRELENAVERAVVLCRGRTIELEEMPQALRSASAVGFPTDEIPSEGIDFRGAVASYQRHLIRQALLRSDNVQRRAAKMLNLSPTTLNEMVHRLGIGPDSDSGPRD